MKKGYQKIFSLQLLATASIAIALPASGQQSAGQEWTLQQCIDYALENNLEIKQKVIKEDLSDVEIEANKGALFPSLSFLSNQNGSWRPWSNSYVNITDGSMSSTASTVNYNGSYGFQSQWTVWNGGINRKQLERSKMAREQTMLDTEVTRLSIEEQIVQLYTQILYQTEAVNVCSQVLESTRIQYNRAKEMYEVGTMSRADLAQVEAQVSQETYNVANAETQLADFKMQLRQLLELPGEAVFGVAVPDVADENVITLLPSVSQVYETALATRPEIRYNKLGIELADKDIEIAKRGYYPTISLQAGINTSASSGLETNWAKQIKTNLSNSLGLTLSVPIFDNRKNATNVAQARLNRESSELAMAQEEKQLYKTIETLWLNATNAQKQFDYANINVKSMRESYNLVSEQFAVGLKDVVDLTTSKNNLLQAEQQRLQAKYTALLNKSLLKFYQNEKLTL